MDWLFGWITDWIKQGLIDAITGQFTGIFESVNNQVTDVAAQVGQTPQGWNGGVFSMIQTLSETVVLPIAGMILTFVLVYELIQMILEKNNMHEFDTFNIFKWVFKTFVATYLLTNCFTIVMAVFDVAQTVVANTAGIINGNLDVAASMADLETQLQAMGIWELIGLWLETNIINLCMWILSIVIFVIVYGRMIEIYLTVSIAPIPFSTLANREWGAMGTNYLRSLFALGFQGFLILICVAIYAVLVQSIPSSSSVHAAIWGTAGYTVLLAFALDPLPDLLLLDEPVSAVDRKGVGVFYDLVTSLRSEYHMPVILVSHDLGHVKKYASKAAFLQDGTVAMQNAVDKVLNNPQVREAFGLD